MLFDFDPDKDEANRMKHGVPLLFGTHVWNDADRYVLASFRPVDGEDRYKAIGLVDGRLWTAVYVERVGTIRLISVRRSNTSEQRDYHRDPR